MRLRSEPVDVEAGPAGTPARVRLGGRWHAVGRVQEAWVVEGRWWGVEERREYVRVETGGYVAELYRRAAPAPDDDPDAPAWRLARVVD